MKFSIIIPHYKTGKMTAYCISQLLRFKGKHDIDIYVVNNNPGDGSEKYILPFYSNITVFHPPANVIQSHGIAYDWIVPEIKTDYFITMESDSFPTHDNWLDYYENLVNEGVDMAGSILRLSGGEYVHPCGAMYKTSNWREAYKECANVKYSYFPNMAIKEGFACHLMVHDSVLGDFMEAPEDYVELSSAYKGYTKQMGQDKLRWYAPTTLPFHNGMGSNKESIKTYGSRNINSETPRAILDNKSKLIWRIGFEPGQWFTYWHFARKKNVVFIPTTVNWMIPDVQQKYTLMRSGLKHLWGVSAHFEGTSEIARAKFTEVEELYYSLPQGLIVW